MLGVCIVVMIKGFLKAMKLKNMSFRFMYLGVYYRVHVVSLASLCLVPLLFVAVDKVHCLIFNQSSLRKDFLS